MTDHDVVKDFFACYQTHDYKGMQDCLHLDSQFSDFAFDIEGADVFAMWEWLCTRENKETGERPVEILSFGNIRSGRRDNIVTATYELRYRFGDTGRRVQYSIDAEFLFDDGQIIRHRDDGSMKTWARQALGPPWSWFHGTEFFRNRVRRRARERLDRFIDNR